MSEPPISLYDPIRKQWVRSSPEEQVRQRILHHMITVLGYPPVLLAVEAYIPSIQRRVDLLCYTSRVHPQQELQPLLIIECKAKRLTAKTKNQILGYNSLVGAPFLCVATATEYHTFWKSGSPQNSLSSVPFLPPYEMLCKLMS